MLNHSTEKSNQSIVANALRQNVETLVRFNVDTCFKPILKRINYPSSTISASRKCRRFGDNVKLDYIITSITFTYGYVGLCFNLHALAMVKLSLGVMEEYFPCNAGQVVLWLGEKNFAGAIGMFGLVGGNICMCRVTDQKERCGFYLRETARRS